MRDTTKAFGGMQPRIEPHLLPAGTAQDAVNVTLQTGKITPLRAPSFVTNLAKVGVKRSLYRYGRTLDSDTQFWFHWVNDADVVTGPIPDDTSERVYYTEAGQPPRVTDMTMATGNALMPTASYLLGVPAATTRAMVVATGPQQDERRECHLAYTFVSAWSEEGPPNEVSEPFEAMSGDTLSVAGMQGPPTGAYNITHKRLYVSVTDASGVSVLRFWKEIPAGAISYADVLEIDLLGEALPEFALIPPPDDLFGLLAHPAGFLVGFSGQRVYRSEVFKPYGWPHFSPLPDEIVGGAVIGQATVICTKGGTYLASQADPITFTPQRLEGNQPCVAKRTIRTFKGGVLYASPDGLVLVNPVGGLDVATEGILTREQWQAYKPESMHAAVHDNRYYCWYDNGTQRGTLILELGRDGVTMTRSDIYATAAYSDGRRDELFVALASDNNVHKWNDGLALTGTWVSRRMLLERPQNVGAVQVIADGYPVQFQLDATIETDSGPQPLQVTRTITHGRPVRLPGHYRARAYTYTVSAAVGIREVTLASTIANITAI